MSDKPIRNTLETGDDFREVQTGHRNGIKSDPAQESAIHHGAGPCAVIAGPGSGKTFVLAERIRYLIEERGVDPSSILVLTFSRAAAAHMRRRFLHSCTHPETVFGTFHSVFFRILQESSGKKYRLADAETKQKYLQHLCRVHPAFLPDQISAEELQLVISRFKNGLACREEWVPELIRIYDAYMQGRGLLDFDDMILQCRSLLMERRDILSVWRDRFKWILVDEFQDVSPCQYQVLGLLASPLNNLFVVGDDDQSIYGFRGADPLMMQRFLRDYIAPEKDSLERTVFLTTNYRCARKILDAGCSLIRCNQKRISKDFRSGAGLPGSFVLRSFTDRSMEYGFIAQEISGMTASEQSRSAVIFRTHGAAQHFLRILQENRIPFSGTERKKEQDDQKDRNGILMDLTAYYRVSEAIGCSKAGREDLLRIMNRPDRFLSGSFVPYQSMNRQELLEHAGYEVKTIQELIRDLEVLGSLSPAYSMRYLVHSVGYGAYAAAAYRESEEILKDLSLEAADCKTLAQWKGRLEKLQKNSSNPADTEHSQTAAGDHPSVKVLTMHACKGLEFDTVFIPDLNEGSIPSRHSWAPDQVEEERRLLYVAMTRARRSLTLTFLEGTSDRPAAPSRFLLPFLQTGIPRRFS